MNQILNLVTLVSTPILIKPWKLFKLKRYVDAQLKEFTQRTAITSVGQISSGEHVLSIFLRTEEPGLLPEKMNSFIDGLCPLLGKPVELSMHDFRDGTVMHFYAGPDHMAVNEFMDLCSHHRLVDTIDNIRYPGLDDLPTENTSPEPAYN